MTQKKHTRLLNNLAFIWNRDILYNSVWVNKYIAKLMLQGKKHLVEKYVNLAFTTLKFSFKKIPSLMLIEKIVQFRPLLSFVNKRMGRKFNPIPIPIKERRQFVLSLNYIVKFTKSMTNRNFDAKIISALSEIFGSKKNHITKKISEDIKYLTDARVFLHFRWK